MEHLGLTPRQEPLDRQGREHAGMPAAPSAAGIRERAGTVVRDGPRKRRTPVGRANPRRAARPRPVLRPW
ncbi:hypothetical protein GCM10010524_11480 [Streptomyces mexicanus]